MLTVLHRSQQQRGSSHISSDLCVVVGFAAVLAKAATQQLQVTSRTSSFTYRRLRSAVVPVLQPSQSAPSAPGTGHTMRPTELPVSA